ncbi:MAG: hypothetical protein R3208_17190 [Ketobacteraceae bacterium]|nr:hypothetical protein [Ketobacteraceae bacterium]
MLRERLSDNLPLYVFGVLWSVFNIPINFMEIKDLPIPADKGDEKAGFQRHALAGP